MRRTCRYCGYCKKEGDKGYCNQYDFEIDNIDELQEHDCE